MSSHIENVSEESLFRQRVKEAGYTSADFIVRYYQKSKRPRGEAAVEAAESEPVLVKRISTGVTASYPSTGEQSWVDTAMEQVIGGVFGRT